MPGAVSNPSEPPSEAVQVEIEAKFIETNDTTIRRLRLKAPQNGGVGLAMLDDSVRGRETSNVLTSAQANDLSSTLPSAGGTDLLSAPRVTTKSGQARSSRSSASFAIRWNGIPTGTKRRGSKSSSFF